MLQDKAYKGGGVFPNNETKADASHDACRDQAIELIASLFWMILALRVESHKRPLDSQKAWEQFGQSPSVGDCANRTHGKK